MITLKPVVLHFAVAAFACLLRQLLLFHEKIITTKSSEITMRLCNSKVNAIVADVQTFDESVKHLQYAQAFAIMNTLTQGGA